MGTFTGKTVLVFGDSRGIGAAIVRRFAIDGANAQFTCAGSEDAAKHLAQETGATTVFADSVDRDVVIDVVHKSGALDILVVSAGIGVSGEVLELNADDIDYLFKINIHAPYHVSAEAARQIPEDGHILIIGSVNGDHMPVAGMAAYAASKPTLQGMARELVHDFRPRGVITSVIQPGPTDADVNPANGPVRDMLHSLMAIKRHGQLEEVTGVVI